MKSFQRKQQRAFNTIIDSTEFKNVLRDHFLHISNNSLDVIEIPMDINVRRHGDFYGLMTELNVSPDLFWITQLINGISASYDYEGKSTYLRLVNRAIIDELLQKFKTRSANL